MKVWLVRHGEAMDDVRNEYGGWHDPELSEKGIEGSKAVASKLMGKVDGVKRILSSPLLRATQTAEQIAKVMNLPVEKVVYLKERNSYGLLCGVNKVEAKEKYPELVAAYDEGKPVLGYEDYDFFVERVKALVQYLGKYQENLIAVTHGKVMTTILKEMTGKTPKTLGDNCILEMELYNGVLTLISSDGAEF
jgi:broad specificity phosphatase PhoE